MPFSNSNIFPLYNQVSKRESVRTLISIGSPIANLHSSVVMPGFTSPLASISQLDSLMFGYFFRMSENPKRSSMKSSFLRIGSYFKSTVT